MDFPVDAHSAATVRAPYRAGRRAHSLPPLSPSHLNLNPHATLVFS